MSLNGQPNPQNQQPGVIQVQTVTLVGTVMSDGIIQFACNGKVQGAISPSGIQLASQQPQDMPAPMVFQLMTQFIQAMLVQGCMQQQQATPLQLAPGGLN